jgi:tryptophan synthase alpha chain
VGFGISRPEHVAAVASYADGAVVGSAIMRIVEEHGADAARLEEFARALTSGGPRP